MRISLNVTQMSRCVGSVAAAFCFTAASTSYHRASSVLAEDGIQKSAATVLSALQQSGNPGERQVSSVTLFTEGNPRTQFYTTGPRITRVFGKSFGSGVSPIDTADAFRLAHSEMFGVAAVDLHPVSILHDARHTQPVMYDNQSDEYKFTLVYYSQFYDGIPVFGADLRLLVRNEVDHPLVLASANLRDLGDFSVPAGAAALEDAELGKKSASAAAPGLMNFSVPERVIWAGVDDMVVEPKVAFKFVGDNNGAANAERPEQWLFLVDAATGAILYRENLILETDVAGNVSGFASEGPGADICAEEVLTPMRQARVSIGGTVAFTNQDGDFVIPNAGDAQVTVESPVRGSRFRVFNVAGADTVLSMNVFPPGPADFEHNQANNNELIRAEVNAYVQSNIVRDMILGANFGFPQIAMQTDFPVYVNRAGGLCPGNAWYDPQGVTLNFCRSGPNRPNTAWSSVVHHEYGHHLVAAGGSGQGAYGEGMGDVLSVLVLDDPRLGLGFFGSCASSLRNADNACQYSAAGCSTCGSDIHTCGQLLSGCVWDTRNALFGTEPADYLQILRSLAVNAVLLHSGTSITPQITIDYLTLDDDDNDIANGTPHYGEIAAGFGAHSMDAPELILVTFSYPSGLPEFVTPNQQSVIQVTVEPVVATPIPDTGIISYRIGNSGPFTDAPMTEIDTNEYQATLPGADCPETIQFYFSVSLEGGDVASDPAIAPADSYATTAAVGSVILFRDSFVADLGWTVSTSAADGGWNRGVPIDCCRGDPPADSDDVGSICYLTDNSAANGCNSDVDNGSTILTSPVLDASPGNAIISYYRWYSNTAGDSPMQDVFVVEVSDDSGSSWLNLETIGPAGPEVGGGWFFKEFRLADVAGLEQNEQFRIRFIASDTDPQSIVEAGVDGIELVSLDCEDLCATAECDDENACTADTCIPETGGCVNELIDCDDENACTVDSCDTVSGCSNQAIDCDDGDMCTLDSCSSVSGCANDAVECGPGEACNPSTGKCQSLCPADLDGDGDVDSADLAELLADWGACPGCPADFDGNGIVDAADLADLISGWGPCL